MSILIEDMEMPERCLECPLYDNYNYYCTLYSFGIPARHNRDGSTRPEWCELKELPKCEDAVSRAEDDLISRLSDLRSRYNCFDDGERDAYHTLSEAIEALRQPEQHFNEWCTDCKEYDHERHCCPRWNKVIRQTLKDAQPDTARRIVVKSRYSMTFWYKCDMCNEPVDAQDNFCRGCGRRLTDEKAVRNQPSAMPKAERRWNPCDWCAYNPPSSMDGKPCTLCPAVANPEPFQKEGG